jgi:hypothetical protein
MSYSYGVIHAFVECEDCGWTTESYKNAQAIAKIHAKKYGHKVVGELGISFSYDFRTEGPEKRKGEK